MSRQSRAIGVFIFRYVEDRPTRRALKNVAKFDRGSGQISKRFPCRPGSLVHTQKVQKQIQKPTGPVPIMNHPMSKALASDFVPLLTAHDVRS